jgi:predicted permease
MANFILILFCLVGGYLLRRVRVFSESTPMALNQFIMYISLPAVVLLAVHKFEQTSLMSSQVLIPISMAWLQFALAFTIFYFAHKKFGLSNSTTGALILTAGLGNTSFLGFPILHALIGPSAIPTAVLADVPGSFLVLSSLGVFTAALFSGGERVSATVVCKRIAKFPPMIALGLALASHSLEFPSALVDVLEKLGGTLVPLALVSVGAQVSFDPVYLRRSVRPLMAGLFFKLIAAPVLIFIWLVLINRNYSQTVHITILEAAMAPMITSSIVAIRSGLNPELSALMLGVGIPLSLVTVPLFDFLLRNFGLN